MWNSPPKEIESHNKQKENHSTMYRSRIRKVQANSQRYDDTLDDRDDSERQKNKQILLDQVATLDTSDEIQKNNSRADTKKKQELSAREQSEKKSSKKRDKEKKATDKTEDGLMKTPKKVVADAKKELEKPEKSGQEIPTARKKKSKSIKPKEKDGADNKSDIAEATSTMSIQTSEWDRTAYERPLQPAYTTSSFTFVNEGQNKDRPKDYGTPYVSNRRRRQEKVDEYSDIDANNIEEVADYFLNETDSLTRHRDRIIRDIRSTVQSSPYTQKVWQIRSRVQSILAGVN